MTSPTGHSGDSSDPRAILSRPAPPPDVAARYGDGPEQVADVWLPAAQRGAAPPTVVVLFLHGGFWRAEYDRIHTRPLAAALAASGLPVCVPEFRRVGQAGGGWPGTFDDVAAAADTLPRVVAQAAGSTGLLRVVLAGHSAGGHLALWAAARHRLPADADCARPRDRHPGGAGWRTPSHARAVVALAAVSDLTACYDQGLGAGAAAALMGGSPQELGQRYAQADPARLLPLGVPLWLVHGEADDRVPVEMSRAFAARARAAGDEVTLRELPDCEHFGLIDPLSRAWPRVLAAFADAARR